MLTARWKLGRLVRGRVPVRLSNLAFSLCLRYCPFGSAFCSMLWALLPRPSGPLLYMTFYDLFESFLPSVFPGCGFFFLGRFTSWRGLGRRSSTLGCRVSYVLLARVCVRPSECNLSDYQTRDTRYCGVTTRRYAAVTVTRGWAAQAPEATCSVRSGDVPFAFALQRFVFFPFFYRLDVFPPTHRVYLLREFARSGVVA